MMRELLIVSPFREMLGLDEQFPGIAFIGYLDTLFIYRHIFSGRLTDRQETYLNSMFIAFTNAAWQVRPFRELKMAEMTASAVLELVTHVPEMVEAAL